MADFDDELLTAAFAEFRAGTTPQVRPAGAAAAYATLRGRRRNRMVAAGVLAALVVAGPTTGYVMVNRDPHGPPVDVGESSTPTPTTAAPTSPPPTGRTGTPSAALDGRISRAVLDGATLDLPPWGPHATADGCPSGPTTFSNGSHPVRDSMSIWIEDVLHLQADGEGTVDTVVRFACGDQGSTFQVVAFDRSADGRIRTIGQVLTQTASVRTIAGIRAGEGGRIDARVGDLPAFLRGLEPAPHTQFQWRSYGWDGDRFRQVGGPAAFPANPRVTDYSVASSDLVFGPPVDGVRTGSVTATVRNLGRTALPFRLAMTLPGGLTLVAPDGCVTDTRDAVFSVDCDHAPLAPGRAREVVFRFTTPVPVSSWAQPRVGVSVGEAYGDPERENNEVDLKIVF
ncbi:hypothetical protein ACN27G_33105 [Plantactinospora sp. WMMB334]|uniref:hypothetical protein n=1 Tax=Plantactinospora sp. WMMB334 TaxID=3404119 RepID=UPI003B925D6D